MAISAQQTTTVPLTRMVRRALPQLRSVDLLSRCAPTSTRRPSTTSLRVDAPLDWREEDLVANDIYVRKGAALLCRGEPFTALYAVRSGSCKSAITTPEAMPMPILI